MMPSTIMVNPIQYVGLWNWRTKNCQIRQNLNSPTQAGAMRCRHTDVSVATDKELPRCDSWGGQAYWRGPDAQGADALGGNERRAYWIGPIGTHNQRRPPGAQHAVADGHPAPSGDFPVSEGRWVHDEQVVTMSDMDRRRE